MWSFGPHCVKEKGGHSPAEAFHRVTWTPNTHSAWTGNFLTQGLGHFLTHFGRMLHIDNISQVELLLVLEKAFKAS